ncbi:MAG: tyrosine-type recombinase/integrase [Clostridia bacterium]
MASYSQDKKTKYWSVRFRIISSNKEVNKRLSGFKQKKEAQSAYTSFMSTYVAPPKINENYDLTTNQLFGLYQEYIKARLKESSQYDIKNNYNNHIAETFGNCNIAKITKHDVLEWQNILNKKGYKYKFKSKLRGLLSSILKFGVMYYDLPFNVVQQVEGFRNLEEKKDMRVWSIDEFNQFINVIDDNILYKTFFIFLYLTGCRKGEAFAVTWDDIDFYNNILTINKSLTRKINGLPYKITTTKNKSSKRKIIVPQTLVNAILKYKDTLADFNNNNFIFGGEKPLAENTVTRTLQRYCIKANVKIITPHDFRHSHASLLISLGENIVIVSKRLGHADIKQTLNTYSHLMPDDENKMIERLDKINICT